MVNSKIISTSIKEMNNIIAREETNGFEPISVSVTPMGAVFILFKTKTSSP